MFKKLKVFKFNSRQLSLFVLLAVFYLWWQWIWFDSSRIEQLVNAEEFQKQFNYEFFWESKRRLADIFVNSLLNFSRDVQNCQKYTSNQTNDAHWQAAQRWTFNEKLFMSKNVNNKTCTSILSAFLFNDKPLSNEEANYPLAYGMTVGNNSAQTYFGLSAIYHPQNLYCLAFDGNKSAEFKEQINKLAKCLPNVTVIEVKDMRECSLSSANAIYRCFSNMTKSKHNWKYYQHLHASDLPLKTNFEMVRILSQLKRNVITDIVGEFVETNIDEALPLWRSNVWAVVSRESANYAIKSDQISSTINYLLNGDAGVFCPKLYVWATMFGNKAVLPNMPGSFDAQKFHADKSITTEDKDKQNSTLTVENPFLVLNRRLGRFDSQSRKNKNKCSNCTFGIKDLKLLLTRFELFAHYFNLKHEPSAYFCLWAQIKTRTFDNLNQHKFKGNSYANIFI